MAERDLGEMMRESTADLVPDVERLVGGGVRRGRVRRRRRQVASAGAAVAAVVVIGVTGAVVGPGLLDGPGRSGTDSTLFADRTVTPSPSPTPSPTPSPAPSPTQTDPPQRLDQQRPPDRRVVVAATDVPATVADLLAVDADTVGPALLDAPYGVDDAPQNKIVHFRYDGALTTLIIERADTLASCRALARGSDARCEVVDGHDALVGPVTTGDGVAYGSSSWWTHGYVVSVGSYNAPDGKGTPILDRPPLDEAALNTIARSEVWFGEPDQGSPG